jgi:hypothetical protein
VAWGALKLIEALTDNMQNASGDSRTTFSLMFRIMPTQHEINIYLPNQGV